jgi:ferredoxin
MKLAHLKRIRVVVSLGFLLFVGFLFVDWGNITPPQLRNLLVALQIMPATIKLFTAIELWSIPLLFLLVLTVLFGRVYCSSVCPLGTIQDVVIRFSRRKSRRRWFRYRQPPHKLQYVVFAVMLLLALGGSMVLVDLLEPFSIAGRIVGGLLRPLVVTVNNAAAFLLATIDVYVVSAIPAPSSEFGVLAVPAVFLTAIVVLSYFRGRLFCNSLCPVGALLGVISKVAIFRIVIDESHCKDCGLCEKVCKAQCIDSGAKSIDFEACVSCFNCLDVCPTVGLKYEGKHARQGSSPGDPVNEGRRKFLQAASLPLAGSLTVSGLMGGRDTLTVAQGPAHELRPVTPPGSLGLKRFSSLCTACHLCVSACPTQVLQPSLLEYGWSGVFQPHMDYAMGYCNYDCILCGEVCPSGAILPSEVEDKRLTQIGKARFVKDDCIVVTKKKDCAACAEHCPTKAVHMVPYERLRLPEVNNDYCVGCGACQHACPVEPRQAILVEANEVHLRAQKPPTQKIQAEPQEEGFPF